MMKRVPPNQGKLLPHVEGEPNFYDIGNKFPLPPHRNIVLKEVPPVGAVTGVQDYGYHGARPLDPTPWYQNNFNLNTFPTYPNIYSIPREMHHLGQPTTLGAPGPPPSNTEQMGNTLLPPGYWNYLHPNMYQQDGTRDPPWSMNCDFHSGVDDSNKSEEDS